MDRNNLRKNFINEFGEEAARGMQAHHVIPVNVLTDIYNCTEADLDEVFNETWNCLMLPADRSGEFVHRGSHPEYSRFVRRKIGDVCQGNITLDGIKTVAMILRTFCNENMQAFMDMELNGTINQLEVYAQVVEQSYSK